MKLSDIKENSIPTPDEAGDRVKNFLSKHKNKSKVPINPGNDHQRNLRHAEHDRADQHHRDEIATSNRNTDESIKEGGMGGLNRCAPSNDVDYEKVLDPVKDTWKGQTVKVTELKDDSEILKRYKEKAQNSIPKNLHQANNRIHGIQRVKDLEYNAKIDRDAKHKGDPRVQESSESNYKKRLEKYVAEAVRDDIAKFTDFGDIAKNQYADKQAAKPKSKVIEIDFHGWTIKYRPATEAGEKVEWMVMDRKGELKKKGTSTTNKDAVMDAQEWIVSGGGTKQQATSNVTIDFNVDFAKEFAPDGETFYVAIDKNGNTPVLFVSTVPQEGFKTSHIRTQPNKITGSTTKLPMVSISPQLSNSVGLQPNGRYVLGDKDPIDDNTAMFPLIYASTVQGKGDMMKLGKPGLTVAHNRDMNEATKKPSIPKVDLGDDDEDFEDNIKGAIANQPKFSTWEEHMKNNGFKQAKNGWWYNDDEHHNPFLSVSDLQRQGKVMKKIPNATRKTKYDMEHMISGEKWGRITGRSHMYVNEGEMWGNFILSDGRIIVEHCISSGVPRKNGIGFEGHFDVWVEEPNVKMH